MAVCSKKKYTDNLLTWIYYAWKGVLPMINEISNWKKREGHSKESVWLKQGITLLRKAIDGNPNDNKTKIELAKLLIRSGTDEKIKYVNLLKAKQLFEEVLALFPNNAESLYRLGHICYEIQEYERGITYFHQALKQSLSEIRTFRAFAAISKAYCQLNDDENALFFLQKAIESDKERNFTPEINELKSFITQEGRYSRSIRYSDGCIQLIHLDQVETIKLETANEDEAELDLSHFYPTFTGPSGHTQLERKEAELLCYLIERENIFVSIDTLLSLWDEGETPEVGTIKSYLSKIRRKVSECIPVNTGPIISNKRGYGYRWTCEVPTKVIKVL